MNFNFNFLLFRLNKRYLTEENKEKLETKLVDIVKDFSLEENKTFKIVEAATGTDNACPILLNVKKKEEAQTLPQEIDPLPDWTVTSYDLGGHSPYFNSQQKLFSTSSSIFLLTFQR